jgi:hypothetical protein
MSKHTPGPWVYLRDVTGKPYIHRGDNALGANGEIVGEACGATDEATDANGRLQAAAPELLEAAEMVLNAERGMNVPPKAAALTYHAKAWHMLQCAVKKAGGEA